MKQYIGAVNSERGHDFARTVAHQLRQNGWDARNEVQMTELGASAELGDVDVLAWKSTGEIQIIECKRLQLARTVAEVAEICRRFRGEAKDELDKHVQRINWIKANPAGLQRTVGFVPDTDRIDDRLVTNTHVPMMYLTSLPIRADKIGPLR
jgi:Holliday junction resolvase